jgi:hypothetical protein
MRERDTKETPVKVRFFHVPDGKRKTLERIIKANLQEFLSRVYTDSSSVYENLFNAEYPKARRMVNHSQEWISFRHGKTILDVVQRADSPTHVCS